MRLNWGIGLLVLASTAISCTKTEVDPMALKTYSGPIIMANNILTVYSDSARPKVHQFAPVQLEFADGDREFPEGITVKFFNKDGLSVTSMLTANYAKYDKQTEIYTAVGNVVVQSLEENKKLMTEELLWKRIPQTVETDKFVRIETDRETLTGTGLTAKQDFTSYKILKPSGTIRAIDIL